LRNKIKNNSSLLLNRFQYERSIDQGFPELPYKLMRVLITFCCGKKQKQKEFLSEKTFEC